MNIDATMRERIATLDLEQLGASFHNQNEFLLIEDFLPTAVLDTLLAELPRLESSVHRNYIPKHKKGGSISRYDLDKRAPQFGALYGAGSLNDMILNLTSTNLSPCPASDPHPYALYYYTEPGDHIGFHYDTSYYKGSRYTVLIGLVDQSTSKLEYRRKGASEFESISLQPGWFVLFNGDKLYHRITPLGPNETRIALTFEYVTDTRIAPFLRFVSNMKDAIAYFGLRQVFGRRPQGSR